MPVGLYAVIVAAGSTDPATVVMGDIAAAGPAGLSVRTSARHSSVPGVGAGQSAFTWTLDPTGEPATDSAAAAVDAPVEAALAAGAATGLRQAHSRARTAASMIGRRRMRFPPTLGRPYSSGCRRIRVGCPEPLDASRHPSRSQSRCFARPHTPYDRPRPPSLATPIVRHNTVRGHPSGPGRLRCRAAQRLAI